MTTLELIIDLHLSSERQGPGSKQDTLSALEHCYLPTEMPLKVADIGCGTGGQTLTLAQQLPHTEIIGVDLFPAFLEKLDQRASQAGLDSRIQTLEAPMDDLPFEEESLDLIWSEGAIYNMGFEAGIKNWKNFLCPGGYLAVSEITWITNSRPKEIEDFWNSEYSEMDVASNKIKLLEANGYTLTGYFYLSKNSWLNTYYRPMEKRFADFLKDHNHSAAAKSIVEAHREEIDLYMQFKDYFSYGFYVARKND